MQTRIGSLWDLLKVHARPRLSALSLVILLGFVTALAQAPALLLIGGIWRVIAPQPVQESAPGEAGGAESQLGAFLDWLEEWARQSQLAEDPRLSLLVALSGIAFLMAVVAGTSMWAYTFVGRRVALQMIVDLRIQLAQHLMGLSMRYHGQRRFGDLLSRISADVGVCLASVNVCLRSLVLQPIMALVTLGAMLVAAPLPTLGIVLLLPTAVLPVAKIAKRVRKGSRKSLASQGASVEALSQMFLGIRTVKSFGGEARELERYRDLNRGFLKDYMKMVRSMSFAQSWTAFYSIAGIGALVLLMGTLHVYFDLFDSGEDLAPWFVLVARMTNHLKNFTKGLTAVGESGGAADRILALLHEEPDVLEAPRPVPLAGLGAGIRFEGVSFTYPDGEGPALQDVDLELRPGETLALVGPSGSGKSTLMDLVARFIDPTEGRITVDGVDLREVRKADWVALTAMVSQTPFLFHAPIGENIAYGREGATQAEIEAASEAADIHAFIRTLPEGYDTNVADMGTRLSGGQRQRITIARALLKGAPLLLLDEATSALDSESEAQVQAALERLMADRTVLVIAHRLSTIRNAQRIAVLDHGRIVEVGSHAELLARGGRYAELHAMQAEPAAVVDAPTPEGVG